MDMLDWARGPLLYAALGVFVTGVSWRLLALARRPAVRPVAPPRRNFTRANALAAALARLWPREGFRAGSRLMAFNAHVFHAGLALVFFGYAPHIAFIHRHTGLRWPALPDAVMYLAAAATIVCLLVALLARLTDPVLRAISRADDLLAWLLTLLPLMTGMAVLGEPSSALLAHDQVAYRGPLAIHLISLELLLAWFPFGKLMHAFLFLPGRMQLATFLGRRGVPS
jgi:nitrate reductase gamma subunit